MEKEMMILQPNAKSQKRRKAILFLILASVFWSTAGLAIKWIPWPAQVIGSFRGGVSFLALLLFFRIFYGKWPPLPGREVLPAAVCYMVLTQSFVIANKLTTSANAILLQYSAPAWVLLFSAVFLKEKIKLRDILIVAVIFGGMSLFFLDSLEVGGMAGNFVAIFSGVVMAVMLMLMKRIRHAKPIETVLWGNLIAFFVGLPFYQGVVLTPRSMLAASYLGVFQLGVAYIFYTFAITEVSTMEAILIPMIEPLLNPLWVFLGTGERPSHFALIGGAIVVSAVVYRSITETSEEAAAAEKAG